MKFTKYFLFLSVFSVLSQTSAQELTKIKAKVGKKEITIEVADSFETRAHGLMNRKQLGENEGMLFVFDREERLSFWMKNTLIPLSIGYFDDSLILVDVHEMVPESPAVQDLPRYTSRKPARFALEMNKGWFAKNKMVRDKSRLSFVSKELPASLRMHQ